jgi:hypothetical protein
MNNTKRLCSIIFVLSLGLGAHALPGGGYETYYEEQLLADQEIEYLVAAIEAISEQLQGPKIRAHISWLKLRISSARSPQAQKRLLELLLSELPISSPAELGIRLKAMSDALLEELPLLGPLHPTQDTTDQSLL